MVDIIKASRKTFFFFCIESIDKNGWNETFGVLIARIEHMEESKYLLPKFSSATQELVQYLNIDVQKPNRCHS